MTTKEHYEVLEPLGTGSFGTVSRIRRKADQKVLVWKEINFGGMSEKEKTQLVAEVNILRELRNPFVVRYHDRIVDKPRTRLYIIMEHCSGGDLGRTIKKARTNRAHIDEGFIWKIFAQVVLALKECHRRVEGGECKPILHRDLKPANILLDADQNIKMADFGLAKELSSQSKLAQTNVGTPFYMAPEIINEKDYDEKSDIWSVGCLLYELAALKPPFDATNAVSLANKINLGKFARIPAKYSDALVDAIRLMLQVDPRKRPRVEELEVIPGLQGALGAARGMLADFKNQQSLTSKMRDLKAREDAVQAREDAVKEREAMLAIKEAAHKREADALKAAQVAFRRMSCEMAVDDDADYSYPLTALPSTLALPAAIIPAPTAAVEDRRGPIPMPMPAAPSFEILCDFSDKVLPPAPPAVPARYIARKSHAPITTGAEGAKENINPFKMNNAKPVFHNGTVLGKENDPKAVNRRPAPADFHTDPSVESSPMKKPRGPTVNDKPTRGMGLGMAVGLKAQPLPATVQIDLDALIRPRYHR